MECNAIVHNETAERYLLRKLSPAEVEAYERHFFECDRCFDELQNLQSIRDVLQALPPEVIAPTQQGASRHWWEWATAAAVAASLVGATALWLPSRQHRGSSPADAMPVAATAPTVAQSSGPSAEPSPGPMAGSDAVPTGASASTEQTGTPSALSPRAAALARLAHVDAPRFIPSVLRGVADEATIQFQRGMKSYVAADYRAAVPALREAAILDASRPDIAFFLGVSSLLSGNSVAAVEELQRVIGMGGNPFLEEAHFYLAKAYLLRGDLDDARHELTSVVALGGELSPEAINLLAQLDGIESR